MDTVGGKGRSKTQERNRTSFMNDDPLQEFMSLDTKNSSYERRMWRNVWCRDKVLKRNLFLVQHFRIGM